MSFLFICVQSPSPSVPSAAVLPVLSGGSLLTLVPVSLSIFSVVSVSSFTNFIGSIVFNGGVTTIPFSFAISSFVFKGIDSPLLIGGVTTTPSFSTFLSSTGCIVLSFP